MSDCEGKLVGKRYFEPNWNPRITLAPFDRQMVAFAMHVLRPPTERIDMLGAGNSTKP